MDSITQASLGALCGEIVLGKKLGYKGALWGLLFGTLPDLDVFCFGFLSSTEQLMWHRGLSHSLLFVFTATFLFATILKKVHRKKNLSYWRCAAFVFLALSTHVLIDCFNTYGTQLMEPFSSERFAIGNIAIIDFFFLLPLLLGLFLACIVFRKKRKIRPFIGWITMGWLCFYFICSLFMKHLATKHFEAVLAEQGIDPDAVITSPTISNIFLWRMSARDEHQYYISYWSIFDDRKRQPIIRSFPHGHALEKDFKHSEDLNRLKWFCRGWHKTFQLPEDPHSIYIAAIHMNEAHIPSQLRDQPIDELRPIFIWKITKTQPTDSPESKKNYTLTRPFKMSREGSSLLLEAFRKTYRRAIGGEPEWMNGAWSWEIDTP